MNSTQKLAWILLSSALFGIVSFVYVGSTWALGRMPPRPLGQIAAGCVAFGAVAFFALTVFLVATRQSRAEPEADERDKMIRAKAATASFLGSWILMVAVLLTLGLTLGQTGLIPVYLVTVILMGVAMVTMLVYGVAILVQYRRGRG